MSIRLRFTLLYNAILMLTLLIFGVALYSIQAQTTFEALIEDLQRSSESIGASIFRSLVSRTDVENETGDQPPPREPRPPMPFEDFSSDQTLKSLPEREIVRVLDASSNLVASPFGSQEDALPLSEEGLQAILSQQEWWESETVDGQHLLIYSRPLLSEGQVAYILQIARPLTERDRTLQNLAVTLVIVSLVVLAVAFGIGWVLSGVTLQPIQRITQTAHSIGDEKDFSRRVAYQGPPDEVGQLANTFNTMLARLEDAYQMISISLEQQRNFVADVSHELRTPLTTLRGNLALLRRTPPIPPEEQTDILGDMVEESDRLIRLVNDLLILARADAGYSLAKETLEPVKIMQETIYQVHQLDPSRQIILYGADDIQVEGERDATKQVFLIALDNALKHSDGEIRVDMNKNEKFVEVRVQDQGEGIPAEKLAHVFDRFYRGEANRDVPGFGLGLAIAKTLVEAQGGNISLESEIGQGSTLILSFPSSE